MAERARGTRRARKQNGSGRGKPRAARPGDNSGEIPEEVIKRHWAQIGAAARASKKADEEAKKKRSALSNCYKACKADGLDPDEMKIARKLDEGNHAEAVLTYKGVGRILSVIESELPLFRDITIPPPMNAYLAGLQSGRNGEPSSNNPHKPGEQQYETWAEGHGEGSSQLGESFRTGAPVQ